MVKTIAQQTGWKRPFPKMICLDSMVFDSVSEFDFDLSNEGFFQYFKERTGYVIKEEHKDIYNMTEQQYLNDSRFDYSETGYKFSEKEKRSIFLSIKITKGKMQDCWELYNKN